MFRNLIRIMGLGIDRIESEVRKMVEISKMKYAGCCFNRLHTIGEKIIYRIEIGRNSKTEICEDCIENFMKEMNEKYSEVLE